MIFEFQPFLEFLGELSINTKEYGAVRLGHSLMGSQRRFFDQLQRGLQDEQHEFVVLKARQLGISTAMLALDMYYAMKFPGTPGTIITHDEPARQAFRVTMEMYYAGLPDEWQLPIAQHNRDQLVFENGSMMQYKVAGLKETSKKVLGRSSAISLAHCTEVAYWGDSEQINSLKASMAEKNPLRLYVWESTANSHNHFYEMWEEAKQSVTIKPIFIGWWAKEDYRVAREGKIWRQYWGHKGRATQQERDVIKQVMEQFDVELTDEQLAWYRWVRAEKVTDEIALLAEYPSLPEEAFQATGSKYFTGQHMTAAYRRVLGEPPCQSFRLQCGVEFTDTELVDVKDRIATLRVWEEPVIGGWYVIGADPAYGSSPDADRYCCTVLRCYANRVEQVAEFCTVDIAPHVFAWVIVYLAGCYQPCLTNIEINGSGTAVIQEIENLRRMAGRVPKGQEDQKQKMKAVVRRMQDYLYTREDSLTGRPMGKHTMTTERIKEAYMGLLKDNFERGIFVPHSRFLLDEMKTVIRDEGSICAQGDAKDDRVIAAALGGKAWNDSLRMALIARSVVWVPPEQRKELENKPPDGVLPRMVRNYLLSVGAIKKPPVVNPNIKTYIPGKV